MATVCSDVLEDAIPKLDRGTVRMQLDDVKRFDSGVVLLTYLAAS